MRKSISGIDISHSFNTNPLTLLFDAQEMAQLMYLNFFVSPKDSHDFGNNAPTAIMSQGFGCMKGAMSILGDNLKESMNVVYADNFPLINTCSIKTAAELLKPTIQNTIKSHKNGDVFLLGYSNGGLIALLALHMATRLKVWHVITMGTPHKGTPRAELVSMVSQSCRDINIKGGCLKGKTFSEKIEWEMLAMVATNDKIVPSSHQIPRSSLMDIKRTHTIEMDTGHFGFIMWNTVANTAEHIRSLVH